MPDLITISLLIVGIIGTVASINHILVIRRRQSEQYPPQYQQQYPPQQYQYPPPQQYQPQFQQQPVQPQPQLSPNPQVMQTTEPGSFHRCPNPMCAKAFTEFDIENDYQGGVLTQFKVCPFCHYRILNAEQQKELKAVIEPGKGTKNWIVSKITSPKGKQSDGYKCLKCEVQFLFPRRVGQGLINYYYCPNLNCNELLIDFPDIARRPNAHQEAKTTG